MKKRFLSLLLVLSFVVSLVPGVAISAGAEGEYDFINGNLKYKITTAAVEGTPGEVCLTGYDGSKPSGELTIPATVTHSEIDYNVTSIGEGAFLNCGSLTALTIPASVKSIGKNAFNNCTSLPTVNFATNSNLETIGEGAFYHCYGLTNITIPKSVTEIKQQAFETCSHLQAVTFEANSNLKTIWGRAFLETAITSIEIPASVTTFKNSVFYDCDDLTTVTFEANSQLKTIGDVDFYNTAITSIEIPASVTGIGLDAFGGVPVGIANVTYEGKYTKNSPWGAIAVNGTVDNDNKFVYADTEKTNLVRYFGTSEEPNTIPDTVKTIGKYAFASTAARFITIPSGVTTIGENAFDGVWNVVNPNTGITGSPWGALVENGIVDKENGFLYDSAQTTLVKCFGTNLTPTIISSVTAIRQKAFSGTAITAITIPASVTTIGENAFSDCTSLASVGIPINSKLTSLASDAFSGCTSITEFQLGTVTYTPEKGNNLSITDKINTTTGALNLVTQKGASVTLSNGTTVNIAILNGTVTIPANTEITLGDGSSTKVKFDQNVTAPANNMDFLTVPAGTNLYKPSDYATPYYTFAKESQFCISGDCNAAVSNCEDTHGYASVEALNADMLASLEKYYGVRFGSNTLFKEVDSLDGNATVKVTLPCPSGTDSDTNFYLIHQMSDRNFEYPTVTRDSTNDTISFTLTGNSPILLGWTKNVENGQTVTISENPDSETTYTVKAGGIVEYTMDPEAAGKVTLQGDSGVVLVTFNYDNGTTAGVVHKKVYGVAVGSRLSSEPDLRSKTDGTDTYYLKGWTASADSPALNSETEFYQDATYTAQWEKLNVTVTLTPTKNTIKVGGGVLLKVTVEDSDLPTWNDAKIVIHYDSTSFKWVDTNDSDITEDGAGMVTIQVHGKDKVSGEVLKTLSFVGKAETTPSADNFTVDPTSTVDTSASALVVDVTEVATVRNTKVAVIAADKNIYTVSLGNGLNYDIDSDTGLIINTVVEGGKDFGGSIQDYDKGYTYTFKANGTDISTTIDDDGHFTIKNDVFKKDTVITVSHVVTGLDKNDVAIFEDFVAGYSLVLVDSEIESATDPKTPLSAANLAYQGQDLYVVKDGEFDTILKTALGRGDGVGNTVYAYIVKGLTNTEDNKTAFVNGITISKAEQTKLTAEQYDVNIDRKLDLNDVQAAYDLYNVNEAMTHQNMAKYIQADVNNTGRVDVTDVVNVNAAYKAQ